MYQCYNNFIRVNSALTIETNKGGANMKRMPSMAEGITDQIQMWKELFVFKVWPSTINRTLPNFVPKLLYTKYMCVERNLLYHVHGTLVKIHVSNSD